MPKTTEIARLFLQYYHGSRRILGYGRWRAFKWAIKMLRYEGADQHH